MDLAEPDTTNLRALREGESQRERMRARGLTAGTAICKVLLPVQPALRVS